MPDRIPKSVLKRERRRLKRMIIAVLAQAMAEADMGPDEIAAKLGDRKGWEVHDWIKKMLDGKAKDFDAVSDLGVALHRMPIVYFTDPGEPPEAHSVGYDTSHMRMRDADEAD
jgi:hypothetical protein